MDKLLGLQETDSEIAHLQVRRAVLESGEDVTAAQAKADEAERVLGELSLRMDEIEREQKRLEFEIDSMTQKSAAEEKRMYDGSVSNSKELESMQAEIKNLKDRRGRVEDDLLEILVGREELESEIVTARTVLDEGRDQLEKAGADSASELQEIAERLEKLATQRRATAAEIDEELLELYDDLRGTKKGIGAAALSGGVCMGCHEQLSALELDKLKKTEGIKRCEYCRRILIDV